MNFQYRNRIANPIRLRALVNEAQELSLMRHNQALVNEAQELSLMRHNQALVNEAQSSPR